MSRKYNKRNCHSIVRASIKLGDLTVSLIGTHAYEWSIVKDEGKKVVILTFGNREGAVKEFEKYKGL